MADAARAEAPKLTRPRKEATFMAASMSGCARLDLLWMCRCDYYVVEGLLCAADVPVNVSNLYYEFLVDATCKHCREKCVD